MLLVHLLLACSEAKVVLGNQTPSPRGSDTDTGASDTAQDTRVPPDTGANETGDPVQVVVAVDLVNPSTGSAVGGDVVAIYGGPFSEGAGVTFDGVAAIVSTWTETTLSIVTPPGEAGLADVAVTTLDGVGVGEAAFTYIEPCEGLVAEPSYVRTGNDDDEDVTITLRGCGTGISATDEVYLGEDRALYGVTWMSAPSSVEGTGTATLRLLHWSRFSPATSYFPYLDTDQGRLTVEVDPR